jgi:hypothetical protein
MAVRIRSHPQATESFAAAEASSEFERTDMPNRGEREELMKIVENERAQRSLALGSPTPVSHILFVMGGCT